MKIRIRDVLCVAMLAAAVLVLAHTDKPTEPQTLQDTEARLHEVIAEKIYECPSYEPIRGDAEAFK